MKAGETIKVEGTLDRGPNFPDSALMYSVNGPEGTVYQTSIQLAPNQTNFTLSFTVPYAAPGGHWTIGNIKFYTGIGTQKPLKANDCVFTVIPNKGLVYPEAARLAISPSQVQLLRSEALNLQAQIQDLKGQIKETQQLSLKPILSAYLDRAFRSLNETRDQYQRLSGGDPSAMQQSNIFFSDIRTSYEEASKLISPSSRYQPIRYESKSSSIEASRIDGYPAIAQGTLRALEHNERAYETVANVESLVFNLEVSSTPSGAKISYRRRGDEFQTAPEDTNATIKSLPYAIWIVRVEAPGMRPQDKEHNALNEDYHVLHFDLVADSKKP